MKTQVPTAPALPTRWWLIRHAKSAVPPGTITGQSDPPADLSDTARLRACSAQLPGGAVWLSSPLVRCRDTARALAPPDTDITTENDFREQHFGEWQGLTHDEVAKLWPMAAATFWRQPLRCVPPGGESFAGMMARVVAALERLSDIYAGRDVVAVVHDGTIRAALAVAMGDTPGNLSEGPKSFVIDNVSVTRIDRLTVAGDDAGWRIAGVNSSGDGAQPDNGVA